MTAYQFLHADDARPSGVPVHGAVQLFQHLAAESIAAAYSQAVEWAECMHAALRE